MIRNPAPSSTGFHDGELAVQQRAGVRADARRLVRMLDHADLTGGVVEFLARRTFAVGAARDDHGRLWTSALTGAAGFLEVIGAETLRVHIAPRVGDPLQNLPAGQPVGLITVDFAKRRRFRVNGHLAAADSTTLTIKADQAYGNCPQYIQERVLDVDTRSAGTGPERDPIPAAVNALRTEDLHQIQRADTFFLGTAHPTRGNDASHRGGPPGFVRVEDERTLWWPDYPGNNMFNSLGNLAVDPTASLLFIDFTTGRTLHLTGRAASDTIDVGAPGDDGGTGRRVRFTADLVTVGPPLPLRAAHTLASPRNPPIRS